MSNIADLAAKLAIYWGNLAGAASGQALQTDGVGRPLSFQPGAASSAGHAKFGFNGTVDVIIVSAGVPVAVSGPATAQGTTQGFTINTTLATITFDGLTARLCNMSAVLAITTVSGVMQLHLNVNGLIVASSVAQSSAGKAFHEVEITQTLEPGDVVTLSAENQNTTNNLEIDGFFGLVGDSGSVNPAKGFLVVATV